MMNREHLQERLDETRKTISRRMCNLAEEMKVLDQIENELANYTASSRLIVHLIQSGVYYRNDLDHVQSMLKNVEDDLWESLRNYANYHDEN